MFLKKKKIRNPNVRSRQTVRVGEGSFRRNDIVLSRSDRKAKAVQQTVTERQQQQQVKRQKYHRRLRIIAIGIFLLIAFILYRSTISDIKIKIEPPLKLNNEQKGNYAELIGSKLGSSTLWRQSWLLDKQKLQQEVTKSNPEIYTIDFYKKPLDRSLQTELTFRKPIFVWQDATKAKQFVDKNGILFSINNDTSTNTSNLVHIEDQSGVILDQGNLVLSEPIIRFISQLHSELPTAFKAKVQLQRVIIPKSTREVQVQIKGKPYLIRLNSNNALELQVGDLKNLLQYLNAHKITPTKYIDLRLEHKAFYK